MNFVKKNSFLQMDPLNEKRDYTKLKVKELKQECKKLGLKKFSSLKKEGLLLRLLSHSHSSEKRGEEKKKSLRGVSSTPLDPSFVTNEEYLNLGKILFDNLLLSNPSQTFGVNTSKWIAKNIPIDFLNSITLLKIKTELNRIKKIFFDFFSVPPSNDKFFLNDEELMKDYLLSGSYIVYFRNILKRRDFFYSPKGDLPSPYFFHEGGSNVANPIFTEIKELRTIIWNRELTLIYFTHLDPLNLEPRQYCEKSKTQYFKLVGSYDWILSSVNRIIENPKLKNAFDVNKGPSNNFLFFAKVYEGSFTSEDIVKDYLNSRIFWEKYDFCKYSRIFERIVGGEVELNIDDARKEIFSKVKPREFYIIKYFYELITDLKFYFCENANFHPIDDLKEYNSTSLILKAKNISSINSSLENFLISNGIPYRKGGFSYYQIIELKQIEECIEILENSSNEGNSDFPLNLLMMREVVYLNSINIFKK